MLKIRRIGELEMNKVNPLLNQRFGLVNQIESGSCEEHEEGKKIYHISLVDKNPYKSEALLRKIGRVVKNVLKAEEVYFMGHNIT